MCSCIKLKFVFFFTVLEDCSLIIIFRKISHCHSNRIKYEFQKPSAYFSMPACSGLFIFYDEPSPIVY